MRRHKNDRTESTMDALNRLQSGDATQDAVAIIAASLQSGDVPMIAQQLVASWKNGSQILSTTLALAKIAALFCEVLAEKSDRSPEELLQAIALSHENQ